MWVFFYFVTFFDGIFASSFLFSIQDHGFNVIVFKYYLYVYIVTFIKYT